MCGGGGEAERTAVRGAESGSPKLAVRAQPQGGPHRTQLRAEPVPEDSSTGSTNPSFSSHAQSLTFVEKKDTGWKYKPFFPQPSVDQRHAVPNHIFCIFSCVLYQSWFPSGSARGAEGFSMKFLRSHFSFASNSPLPKFSSFFRYAFSAQATCSLSRLRASSFGGVS